MILLNFVASFWFVGVYTATVSKLGGVFATLMVSLHTSTAALVSPCKSMSCSSKSFISLLIMSAACHNSPSGIIATVVVAGVLALALFGVVAYLLMSRRKSKGVDPMPSMVSTHEKSTLPSEMDVPYQEVKHRNVAELEAAEWRSLLY